MTRTTTLRRLAAAALIALAASSASAQDGAGRPLPFSDDIAPPAPLPLPLDRHLRGDLREFDGEHVRIRWDWSDPAQLEDFDAFVPVRSGLSGDFSVPGTAEEGDGTEERDASESPRLVYARGTAGIRLRLGMLSDLTVDVTATLHDPHDLGIVLVKPDVSDESILCLVQDRFWTRFDAAAGNTNMINKIGGIPATAPGVTEFRYVDRKTNPVLSRGDTVTFAVRRDGDHTSFTITQADGTATTLQGTDPDTAMTHFTPGLYVAAAAADFGPLDISGRIDPDWFATHDVLPHVASDLLHPGNRFKGKEKKAAQQVEGFLSQDADTPEKARVAAADVAALVGRTALPMVIRIRAAEALMERGIADGTVVAAIARLLHEGDRAARLLAWQVVRPQLPWHFRYEVDGPEAERKEAALLVGNYLRERDDELANGKVFVDGYWYTPSRADAVRGNWETAWDLRTEHVRVRTNLSKEWADWYLAALEASYREMVRVIGRAPPRDKLPLSVLVFDSQATFTTFCDANEKYASLKSWGRFEDQDRVVAFVTLDRRKAPLWSIAHMAKLFLTQATGTVWPTWFSEGRAAWFGNPDYRTASWDGHSYTAGRPISGPDAGLLRAASKAGDLDDLPTFLARDPRRLEGSARRLWYVQAWALHHWLMAEAPADVRRSFARWQQAVEERAPGPREADAEGRRLFLTVLAGQIATVQQGLSEFLGRLE